MRRRKSHTRCWRWTPLPPPACHTHEHDEHHQDHVSRVKLPFQPPRLSVPRSSPSYPGSPHLGHTVAWARPGVVTDDSARGGQGEGSNSPFARFSSSISGYIPVRSSVPPSRPPCPLSSLHSPLHRTQWRPYERRGSVCISSLVV